MQERGQSLVELAISILFLLLLLAGAAEFGVLFFQFVQLRDAAQKGAASVEGFHETHMGVLEAAAVSARLNELLARAGAP